MYRVAAVVDSSAAQYEYADNRVYTSVGDAERAIERMYKAREDREERSNMSDES
jgi:hypothetical protein